uniref:Uncharacterized protein n=1 Tax=Anopheles arabiensis TaxID=7173 RepID=A0A3F2YSG1_ANOAR
MYSKIIVVLALVAAVSAQSHKRTVTYHVEGKSGFIAEVHREPIKGYQAPQPHHQVPSHYNYQH